MLSMFLLVAVSAAFWMSKPMFSAKYRYFNRELNLDFSNKNEISKEKRFFLDSIIRRAQYSNYLIQQKKERLIKVQKSYKTKGNLRGVYKHWFNKLRKEYLNNKVNLSDSIAVMKAFDELNFKVQIVPVRLTLAQAILESAWGTSRFAREGHAYFGIHCYSKGCGMKFGSAHSHVFVKSYPNMMASVEDYMHFLNTKKGVKNFRFARQVYFDSKNQDIRQLAKGLISYSQIGGDYQKILDGLFKDYIPDQIDDY